LDGVVRQLAALFLGGHGEFGVGIVERFEEQGLVGLTGEDGGTGVSALEPSLAGIEGEAALALAFLGGVAFVAVLREEGADVFFKVGEPVFRGGAGWGREKEEKRKRSKRCEREGEGAGFRGHRFGFAGGDEFSHGGVNFFVRAGGEGQTQR
jgi:hypothetical protein